MLFGVSYPVVMGTPCFGGGMLTGGMARAFGVGTADNGALGCADSPGSIVTFLGGATSFFIFTCLRVSAL